MSSYSKAKIVGFLTITLILFVLIFITFKIVSTNKAKQKEKASYLTYHKENIKTNINGNFLEYIPLNTEYQEESITAFYKDEDISDKTIISYFTNNEQVSYIDSSKIGTYLVKYTILANNKTKEVYKTVIVIDNKNPTIDFPKKTTISINEAKNYDLKKDVIVKDNSGKVKLKYVGNLDAKEGKYIITYEAIDSSNNKQIKKRIIRVK